jgi:hypothetical protein
MEIGPRHIEHYQCAFNSTSRSQDLMLSSEVEEREMVAGEKIEIRLIFVLLKTSQKA